jgi:hypothetical protein
MESQVMTRTLFYLAIGLLATTTPLRATDLPASITAQLPADFEPMSAVAGPTVEAGRNTWLVVIHHHEDTMDNPSPRALLIFEQAADGSYKIAARNDNVVFPADGGGQCDPFPATETGLAVKGSYFTVENGVSCGQHWTDYITFRYDTPRHEWLFSSEIYHWFEPLGPGPDSDKVTRADRAKPVTFANWRPAK